jgi:hypothetical protein
MAVQSVLKSIIHSPNCWQVFEGAEGKPMAPGQAQRFRWAVRRAGAGGGAPGADGEVSRWACGMACCRQR